MSAAARKQSAGSSYEHTAILYSQHRPGGRSDRNREDLTPWRGGRNDQAQGKAMAVRKRSHFPAGHCSPSALPPPPTCAPPYPPRWRPLFCCYRSAAGSGGAAAFASSAATVVGAPSAADAVVVVVVTDVAVVAGTAPPDALVWAYKGVWSTALRPICKTNHKKKVGDRSRRRMQSSSRLQRKRQSFTCSRCCRFREPRVRDTNKDFV